jgi:hypothetical protein
VEGALWAAVRALEDRQALLERMAQQAGERKLRKSARSFLERAAEAGAQASAVRSALAHAAETTLQMAGDSEEVQSERRGLV